MYSPETVAKIQQWRQRAAAGTLTRDEMKEVIACLREDRIGAAQASANSRARKAPVDTTSLLAKLKGPTA